MDPLSIALGVIALLELTKKVIVYAKQTKDAPTDRTKILQEAASLMGLLIMLKEFIEDCDGSEDSWLQATSSLTAPDGPLQQYKLLLETVVAKITPGRGQRKFGQALAWIFSKEEVTRLLSQIERVKSFVQIALEIDHTFVSLLFFCFPWAHLAPSAIPSTPISSKADGTSKIATASHRETFCKICLSRWCNGHEWDRKPMVPPQ